MISLSLQEIVDSVGGSLSAAELQTDTDQVFSGAPQTDSRLVQPGDIFFARVGEETDGHLFVPAALENGAALVVAERPTTGRVPEIVVADSTEALRLLAKYAVQKKREAGGLKVVGITGSNGKTTTKNLVGAMLATAGNTVASEKSFNNEVGGPMTALRITEDTEYLVAEMGASYEGDIARLVDMAPPNIGVVLSVGLAHAGEFGGIEATYRAKSEMVTGLTDSDTAILNIEDPRVVKMAELTSARVVWFGLRPEADIWASDIETSLDGTSFKIHLGDLVQEVKFPVIGEHHVMNALAATAVATELGVSLSEAVGVLEKTTRPAKWRMEVSRLPNGVTLINDAYNASPDSMRAALKTLAQISKPGGRSVAVLGSMSELGEFSGQEHDQLGLLAVRLRISQLVIVGADARRLHISAINEGSWDGESVFFETHDEALDFLTDYIKPEDTIIVKSSNSGGLRFLGDRLKEALA